MLICIEVLLTYVKEYRILIYHQTGESIQAVLYTVSKREKCMKCYLIFVPTRSSIYCSQSLHGAYQQFMKYTNNDCSVKNVALSTFVKESTLTTYYIRGGIQSDSVLQSCDYHVFPKKFIFCV